MKLNYKSILISIGLLMILAMVLFIEAGIFVSGPARAYERELQQYLNEAMEKNADVSNIERHIFQYVVYVGENEKEKTYVWMDENYDVLMTRKQDTLDLNKVEEVVKKEFQDEIVSWSLGYGYESAVIDITLKKGQLLLDYDTLETVFYREVKE